MGSEDHPATVESTERNQPDDDAVRAAGREEARGVKGTDADESVFHLSALKNIGSMMLSDLTLR